MPSHCLLDFVVAILCILLRTQSGACIQGSEPYIHKIDSCSCLRSAASRTQIGNFSECILPWVAAAHLRTGQEATLFVLRLTNRGV